jgi:hypothetical protein
MYIDFMTNAISTNDTINFLTKLSSYGARGSADSWGDIPQPRPQHFLRHQHLKLHAPGDMSIFLYASSPNHQSPRGGDVGAFHGNLPQVTQTGIQETTR